jgi:hypothetical protein
LPNGHSHPSHLSFSVHAGSRDCRCFALPVMAWALRLLHPEPTSIETTKSTSTQETTFMNSALGFIEPTDRGLADQVFTRTIKDGEERLMLAVLESAIEDFQKYVLAHRFSHSKTSAPIFSLHRTTCAGDSCTGRRPSAMAT